MVGQLLTREHIEWFRSVDPRFITEGSRDLLMGHIDALTATLSEIRECEGQGASGEYGCGRCYSLADRALNHRDEAQ